MATVTYPATLPAPAQALTLTPVQTRREYGRPGPWHVRVYGVDRLYTGSVQLVLIRAQVETFRIWWRDTLALGGAWFAAAWPTQRGAPTQSWRISEPPQYEHIAQGIWRVTFNVEVRGTGSSPDDEA